MTILRTFPFAQHPFMQFQVGRMETRPFLMPVFIGRKVERHIETYPQVSVFRLLGFGATQIAAEQMAKRNSKFTPETKPA